VTTHSAVVEPPTRRWVGIAATLAPHMTLITGGLYAATIVLTLAIASLLG
jgi:hypothetical protein